MKNPTRHKSEEASYFLSMMKQTFDDDVTFSYNLSAFLSAARSITFYIQKQYAGRVGFAEWYCQRQIEMTADSELKYLNEIRVEDVHRESIAVGSTRELGHSSSVVVVKPDASVVDEQVKQVDLGLPIRSTPKTIRRFFPNFKRVDVLEFCENQLVKLVQLVEECEKRFQ